MNVKEKAVQLTASVNRWLKKLVGEENDIIFHFVRIVLACILLAALLALSFGIIAALRKVVLLLAAFIVAEAPIVVMFAIAAGVVALGMYNNRSERRRKLRESERQAALDEQVSERQRARGIRIQQSVFAADQRTKSSIETVVAALRRFDLRLELAITPAHYTDLFGDNWVTVREFAESSLGREVPEVSGLLVEIIILYKQAQDIPWIPGNSRRMRGWWGEASRKRQWLSKIIEAAQASPGASGSTVFEAEPLDLPEAMWGVVAPTPEMGVRQPPTAPSGTRGTTPIPEMAVVPPPAAPSRRPQGNSSIPEMASDPLFNDMGKWYEELAALPGRFKVAAIAYHSDGEAYHYAPVLFDTDDIAGFASTRDEMFGEAYRKFVTEIPDIKPNVMFTALWVEDDDLDYVQTLLYACARKAGATLAGTDTHFQRRGGIACFHAATASLTEGEQFELAKSFDLESR